jgi:hypothetical protein
MPRAPDDESETPTLRCSATVLVTSYYPCPSAHARTTLHFHKKSSLKKSPSLLLSTRGQNLWSESRSAQPNTPECSLRRRREERLLEKLLDVKCIIYASDRLRLSLCFAAELCQPCSTKLLEKVPPKDSQLNTPIRSRSNRTLEHRALTEFRFTTRIRPLAVTVLAPTNAQHHSAFAARILTRKDRNLLESCRFIQPEQDIQILYSLTSRSLNKIVERRYDN